MSVTLGLTAAAALAFDRPNGLHANGSGAVVARKHFAGSLSAVEAMAGGNGKVDGADDGEDEGEGWWQGRRR